jgi:transcriptional regulator of arginine metabolism
MLERDERRDLILALLAERRIKSQQELAELLARRGHEVNQATLSRDLRALGVRKAPDGYEVPSGGPAGEGAGELQRAVLEWLETATPAQNLVVVRTPPGGAQPLAVAIDRAGLPEVVGTVAGDDTVLAVCPTVRHATRLARGLLERKERGR